MCYHADWIQSFPENSSHLQTRFSENLVRWICWLENIVVVIRIFGSEASESYLHSARVCGQLATVNKITKPSHVFSSAGVQNRIVHQRTGPANQWEESRGTRQGSTQPIDQSEQERHQRAAGQKPDRLWRKVWRILKPTKPAWSLKSYL